MSVWLKQSTAVTVSFGPFVSSTDGFTPQTALSLTQAETRLSKNGGSYAQKNDSATATHLEEGNYSVTLNATDTGTLGFMRISIYVTGALPVWRDFHVVPANVWDSLFGASKLLVSVNDIAANAITATAIATDAITSAKIATDSIGAAQLAPDAATEIANAVKAAVVETAGSYTLQQALSIMLAVLAGRTSSSGATISTADGSATRVAATIDGSNNRTAMALTPSA